LCEDLTVRASFRSILVLPLLAISCGGSAFETGGSAPDAAIVDSGARDSGTGDSPSVDTGSPPVEAGVCAPLTSADADVYVDSRFMGMQATGAMACPLHTVQQGLTAARMLGGNRTVHVAGSTPALVYDETGSLDVSPGITLMGGSALTTTISASGPCTAGSASGTCAVIVEAGGVVQGFTIVSPSGDGIWTASGTPTPLVHDVAANGSKNDGIVAYGGVDLGPNIGASDNGNAGVESPMGATSGVVHVITGINGFSGNKGNGIDLSGAATLNFEGGLANDNFQGLRIDTMPTGSHTITGLTAKGNTGTGVLIYGGQTLKVRSSSFLGNGANGLYYAYANGSALDLGTSTDSGGNVFGGSTSRNTSAGLTLCNAPASQSADGDSWVNCPPTQAAIVCGVSSNVGYKDVLYEYQGGVGSTGQGPISGTCSVGP
jgi:hypothetical protein